MTVQNEKKIDTTIINWKLMSHETKKKTVQHPQTVLFRFTFVFEFHSAGGLVFKEVVQYMQASFFFLL